MNKQPAIIKVRRGLNGFKYSACDVRGYFIRNFVKLADVRRHWYNEIRTGQVVLVWELDQMPDMSKLEATRKNIKSILKAYARRRRK